MRGGVELSNVKNITFILEDRSFVVIHVKVVRCREEGHDRGETCSPCLSIHTISVG